MRKHLSRFAFVLSALALGAMPLAQAAGGSSVPLPSAPIDRSDYNSLQRGAATFMNYCSGCHSAAYLRYGRIGEDLGISEDLLRSSGFMAQEAGLVDGIVTAMPSDKAATWLGQAPPDLSLSAKLRGPDWLYGYLRAFYRDDSTVSGWNNSVFENVAMPHVLADLQGEMGRDENGETIVLRAGKLTPTEYNEMIIDLVNFMDYAADPAREQRHRAGYVILSLLFILLIFAFFLYRDYWRDIS